VWCSGTTPIYRTLGFADTTGQQLTLRTARADLLAAVARQEVVVTPAADYSSIPAGTASSAAHHASIAQPGVEAAEVRHRFMTAQAVVAAHGRCRPFVDLRG
jgi:hypothetical protein